MRDFTFLSYFLYFSYKKSIILKIEFVPKVCQKVSKCAKMAYQNGTKKHALTWGYVKVCQNEKKVAHFIYTL